MAFAGKVLSVATIEAALISSGMSSSRHRPPSAIAGRERTLGTRDRALAASSIELGWRRQKMKGQPFGFGKNSQLCEWRPQEQLLNSRSQVARHGATTTLTDVGALDPIRCNGSERQGMVLNPRQGGTRPGGCKGSQRQRLLSASCEDCCNGSNRGCGSSSARQLRSSSQGRVERVALRYQSGSAAARQRQGMARSALRISYNESCAGIHGAN